MSIKDTNSIRLARTHFSIALESIGIFKEIVDSDANILVKYGILFSCINHLREGLSQVDSFLDENKYTELDQTIKANLRTSSGAIKGYMGWMMEEFLPGIANDEAWERQTGRSLDAFDDGKKNVPNVEPALLTIDDIISALA
ncbi:hypothetical protein IJM16_03300 [Candidatus Saccharibacteria bacterium]|nr:hypothetical protein [Candidatus Saccharibacteria bacterium]